MAANDVDKKIGFIIYRDFFIKLKFNGHSVMLMKFGIEKIVLVVTFLSILFF